MAEDRIIQIDSVDAYNKLYGWETLHPLVTVVNHTETLASLNHSRLNYGLQARLPISPAFYTPIQTAGWRDPNRV